MTREEAIKQIKWYFEEDDGGAAEDITKEAVRMAVEALEKQTTDVVEVVRCKDCKWYEILQLKKDGTDDCRYKPSYCTLYYRKRNPDWFCTDGERREETDA